MHHLMSLTLLVLLLPPSFQQEGAADEEFSPTLTARCLLHKNRMVVTLSTLEPFQGLIISGQQRNNSNCIAEGRGATTTVLELNMQASLGDVEYCGVSVNYKTSDRTALISVRQNKVIELAQDKNYLVSCGRFDSVAPEKIVSAGPQLGLYSGGSSRSSLEVIRTHPYKLKVKGKGNFRVRNCFAFGDDSSGSRVPLVDPNGCPEGKLLSRWSFSSNSDGDQAEAQIYSMFRFPSQKSLTIQCHVLFCNDNCPNPVCTVVPAFQRQNLSPDYLIGSNDTDAIASTTVTILEPGEKLPLLLTDDDDVCTGKFCPVWLLWVAIVLGVLFLLMLLVNLFLCTALTCTCTRTELIEKEPSIIEDYDPYNNSSRSYFNEQYNNTSAPINNKAYSDLSDHYANLDKSTTRPNSRI